MSLVTLSNGPEECGVAAFLGFFHRLVFRTELDVSEAGPISVLK
jgi:hypothetical protein